MNVDYDIEIDYQLFKEKITTNNLSIMSLHNILNFKLIYDAIFNFTKT